MRSARVWDGEHAGTAIKTHLADRTVHAGNELLSSGGQICLSCLFIVFLFFLFWHTTTHTTWSRKGKWLFWLSKKWGTTANRGFELIPTQDRWRWWIVSPELIALSLFHSLSSSHSHSQSQSTVSLIRKPYSLHPFYSFSGVALKMFTLINCIIALLRVRHY